MDLQLSGRTAIVTGGRRGIGLAIARRLVEEGCHVSILSRESNALAEPLALLADLGLGKAFGATVDLTDGDAYRSCLEGEVARLGGLDIFVHNASGAAGFDEAGWQRNLQTDIFGLTRAADVVVPAMRASGGGSIVALSSIAAQEEFSNSNSFGPMKAAMTVFANNLAQRVAADGIRVNIVSPGPVEYAGGSWERVRRADPERFASIVARMPYGRMGTEDEIADVVAFLASPRSSLVTSTNLVADGGYTKRYKF
ncbi:MAG: short-chain dehydrogenase/reductase [Pseudonocardiales bacterium]|jgi:3-oxoacyl-[acyl-carrier protein] reductase|nr:short-chain dehydrogenase/reductase [Pseudonocardiales bacterium]